MLDRGRSGKEVIRPDFNRAIMRDFQGAQITSDTDFLLWIEVDDCFKIMRTIQEGLKGLRSPQHNKQSLVHLLRHHAHSIH